MEASRLPNSNEHHLTEDVNNVALEMADESQPADFIEEPGVEVVERRRHGVRRRSTEAAWRHRTRAARGTGAYVAPRCGALALLKPASLRLPASLAMADRGDRRR